MDAPVIEAGELAEPTPTATPAVYVFAERETSQPSSAIQRVRQLRQVTIALQLFVRSAASPRTAGDAREQLPGLLDQVDAALLGWTPPGAAEPLEHEETALVGLAAHQIVAVSRYRTTRFVTDVG